MTFLTPLAALAALAALPLIAADLLGAARATAVGRALGLTPPRRGPGWIGRGLAAGAVALFGLAAARRSAPEGASQALAVLGILAFEAVSANGASNQTDAAIADFTDAVRADPGNEPAKYDLELLLRLTAAHGDRTGAGQGSGVGRTGRRGGAGGLPGSGY